MVPDVQMAMNNVCPFSYFYFKKASHIGKKKKKHCFSYMEIKIFPVLNSIPCFYSVRLLSCVLGGQQGWMDGYLTQYHCSGGQFLIEVETFIPHV